jgi:hypothetical protein
LYKKQSFQPGFYLVKASVLDIKGIFLSEEDGYYSMNQGKNTQRYTQKFMDLKRYLDYSQAAQNLR